MLKQQTVFLNKFAVLLDLCALGLAFVLAYDIRAAYYEGGRPIQNYVWILVLVGPIWLFFLNRYQLYASIRRVSLFDIATRVFNVHLFGGMTLAALIYFFDKDNFSRSLYLLFVCFAFLLLLAEKVVLRLALGHLRSRGYNTRNLLIVGTQEKARRFCQLLELHADWGLTVTGFLTVKDEPAGPAGQGQQVLGDVSDLIKVCKTHPVDEVVFCLPKDYVIDAESHLLALEELGITVRMVLDFYQVYHSKRELSLFHEELPILTYHTKSLDAQQLFIKRLIDILGALVGLTLLGLMFPLVALAIKRDSPGPIFFGQNRVGENGRIFKCWKFRSMYLDAEERKKELMAQNEMKGAIFKIKDDPRITPVGRFLRKTSLDEFPQFLNVLKGEMSLVGTRPPTPAEVEQYEDWHRRRIIIKPGITGRWQVSGRNQIEDFDEIVRLDLDYIETWSLWQDFRILLKTFYVVLAREGSS
ncbi:MAG: sugar transferase [Deltaproteobacteria bacterium]|nr:sugar transferase [Deltaproteobacteria bacterium]NCP03549.1 sugar transferase [Deltaproteobacteria bacterium]